MTRRASRLCTFALALFAASTAHAKTYGLVVGIDNYEHLPKLRGAVNDARDISQSLTELGADKVITLLDRDATRDAVMGAWNELTRLAKPGDTIIFSYAGHGGQEPERVPGSETDDGLDEVFQLAAFHPATKNNRERIVDDEINQMFAKVPHLKIVFVADSCHSGTMTRSFDSRAGQLSTRLGEYGPITNDQLPPPDPTAALISEELLGNVLYFGAVQDHQVVQEFLIERQARGVLSWSFARALRGHADLDQDGVVKTRELERYLIENVRTRSEGRQSPQMTPRGNPADVTIPIREPDATETVSELALKIINAPDADSLRGQLKDVTAPDGDLADLIWDYESGDIISSKGDVVARIGPDGSPGTVQAIVDKWLLLLVLEDLAQSNPLAVRLDKADKLYSANERVTIELADHEYTKLIAVNLAVDGTIQFVIPDPFPVYDYYRGELEVGKVFQFPLKVTEPFGADHFVALALPEHDAELIDLLHDVNGKKSANTLREKLPLLLKRID